jgi:sec-independent protein translocase protein TatB
MRFSEMLFLTFFALIVFGPKKLPHVAKQIGRVLSELKSVISDFNSQLKIEIEEASKQEKIAPASLSQSKLPTETGPRTLETGVFGTKHERVEAFHG